jgi:hypothetical protein
MGQQQVVLKSISDQGCFKLKSTLLDITEELKADFTVSSKFVSVEEPVLFTESGIGTTDFSWDFGDGLTSNLANPSHTYSINYADSSIRVVLEASNASGCRDTQSRILEVRPYSLDLELKNLFLSESNGQITIGVELKNNGNSRLTKAELEISLPQIGSVFTEVWNGSIESTKTNLYILKSTLKKSSLANPNGGDFICVEALGFDAAGRSETNLENNKTCVSLDSEDPIVTLIAPNPITSDLNFDLILTKEETITFEIIDAKGDLIITIEDKTTFTKGYHRQKYSVQNIGAGIYFLRITTPEITQNQRFIKQ